MAQNVPKVIKVVNLKRFMPEAHPETKPKIKHLHVPVSTQSNISKGSKGLVEIDETNQSTRDNTIWLRKNLGCQLELAVPKVIKVVNLKRFMPEAHPETKPKIKHLHVPVSTQSNISKGSKGLVEIDETNQSTRDNTIWLRKNLGCQLELAGNGSKIKFRNCSHTVEELSTLHECIDDSLVRVGDTFDSRDSFKQYLNDNAKRWHYYYVCRNSKKKVIEYDCICMAYSVRQRDVVIRKQKKRTTACPCKIRLSIDQNTSKVIVYYVCNHHDHPTTASAFHQYPHAKYLPQHIKEEFLDLTYVGLDVDLVQKYVHSLTGITIKKKDIWSYAYRYKRKIFQRSISNERQKYIESLITKIRRTYGESLDNVKNLKPNVAEQSEVVLSIKEINLKNDDNNTLNSLSDDPSINYNEELLDVLGDTAIDSKEIIIQYINEDGILCDKNGVPITNSSAIMQFINNCSYTPDQDLQHKNTYNIQHNKFSELVDIQQCPDYLETVRESTNTIFESEPCTKALKSAVLNDDSAELRSESMKQGFQAEKECYKRRLSPTPDTPAAYVDMENFRKYYYVDHRYIQSEDQDRKAKGVRQYVSQGGTGFSSLVREEYIKAPDFVCHPTWIRHCSGHEGLALLSDPDAILPGAKFLTHDVFLTYINERASRWFFYYSLVESGKSPEHYVYKCVYGRSRVGRNAYRAKGLRKRNKLTTQCPCHIRLRRVEADPAYLTVLYSCNHHDHELDSRHFTSQPHSRRLPPVIKEEVKDLISLGVSADVLRAYVFAETGVRVYGKYFHNVRTGMRARGDRRCYSEEKHAALVRKIRDLEAIYGNSSKEYAQENLAQNQPKQRKLYPYSIKTEDRFTQVAMDEAEPQTEYCELSDRDDFAEEVYIMQADTLPTQVSAQQNVHETVLSIYPVTCDEVRSYIQVTNTCN